MGNEAMNALIRRAAGKSVEAGDKPPTANQAMNELIRKAAGRLPESKEDTDGNDD